MKRVPEISVVMAVRNGGLFLQKAIDSILGQDFEAFEFLIIDDGSTDETRAILRRQTDKRIRVFHREQRGLPASLNFGVQESRSPLIARQDADDLSEPGRLGRLRSKLAEKPDACLVHSACYFTTESSAPNPAQYVPRSRALIALSLCFRSIIVHGSAMFRKHVFLAAGGYNEEFLQSQDYDLWSRMIEVGPFAYCKEKLYQFHIHTGSVSFQKAEAQKEFARRIALNNCQRWFQVDELKAASIMNFLRSKPNSQSIAEWLNFIRHDLPRLRYQSAELYVWAAVQTVRAARKHRDVF